MCAVIIGESFQVINVNCVEDYTGIGSRILDLEGFNLTGSQNVVIRYGESKPSKIITFITVDDISRLNRGLITNEGIISGITLKGISLACQSQF